MNYNLIKFINQGFTLTEVLIALAIVSVIASMTIPSLLKNIENRELRIAFKKTYTELSQATQRMVFDNDGTTIGNCSTNADCVKNKYVSYLKVIKHCDTGKSNGNCWHANDGSTRNLSGTTYSEWGNHPAFILNNGSIIRLWLLSNCNIKTYSGKGSCGEFTVDVNGLKKPNTIGRDIFFIHLHSNDISPWGTSEDDTNSQSQSSNCSKNLSGFGCAALALQDKIY